MGLIVSLFTAISGFVIGQITAQPVQPTAVLKPDSIDDALVGQDVIFSAEESQTNDGSELDVMWKVDGDNPENSLTTSCEPNGLLLRCNFFALGSSIISVEIGNDGPITASAAASVRVYIKDGYITFLLNTNQFGKTKIADIQRALINNFEWPNIQANVDRPIVLHDPDSKIAVFAANLTSRPDSEKPKTNILEGITFYTKSSIIEDLSYLQNKFQNEGIRIVSAQNPGDNSDVSRIDGAIVAQSVKSADTDDSPSAIIDLIDSLDGFDGTISSVEEGVFSK